MKIGFIGTGTLAEAIVTGLDRAAYPYDEIVVSERNAGVSALLAERCARVRVSSDNQAIVDAADILFLTVRPQVADEVLSALAFRPGQLVVSVIATFDHDKLARLTGPDVTVIRAMPLPFVATCEGPTPVFPANETVEALFTALGQPVVCATHEEFETITVVSMTMGLYFGMQEAISDWLGGKGIAGDKARTVIDAVYMNLAKTGRAETGLSLAELRAGHSTKGGLNEQVYREFAANGGLAALRAALDSAYQRVMPGKADGTK